MPREPARHNIAKSPLFPGALSETSDLPFADCTALVPPHPGVIFWHAWPDDRMHQLAEDSGGVRTLARETAQQLTSDDLWAFAAALTTGGRLVITSDQGYANIGLFPDLDGSDHGKAPTQTQAQALKSVCKSGRCTPADDSTAAGLTHWAPPLTRELSGLHGDWQLVLGRKKWKSQRGYPTLAHGGVTLLEVAVPFIETSKGTGG